MNILQDLAITTRRIPPPKPRVEVTDNIGQENKPIVEKEINVKKGKKVENKGKTKKVKEVQQSTKNTDQETIVELPKQPIQQPIEKIPECIQPKHLPKAPVQSARIGQKTTAEIVREGWNSDLPTLGNVTDTGYFELTSTLGHVFWKHQSDLVKRLIGGGQVEKFTRCQTCECNSSFVKCIRLLMEKWTKRPFTLVTGYRDGPTALVPKPIAGEVIDDVIKQFKLVNQPLLVSPQMRLVIICESIPRSIQGEPIIKVRKSHLCMMLYYSKSVQNVIDDLMLMVKKFIKGFPEDCRQNLEQYLEEYNKQNSKTNNESTEPPDKPYRKFTKAPLPSYTIPEIDGKSLCIEDLVKQN